MGSMVEATMSRLSSAPAEAGGNPEWSATKRLRSMVDHHFEFVWRSVRRLGVPAADADDVTQRVFWLASRRLDRIVLGSERAYLFAVAARSASDFRRAHARDASRELVDQELIGASPDKTPDVEALVDQKRARDLLDCVLDKLPIELRTVLVLAEGEGMTMSEISELLELPQGTVASRLRRARAWFASCVEQMAMPGRGREEP